MKCRLAISIGWSAATLLAAPAFCAPSTPPPAAVLSWNNGETLAGEILEASSSDITWKTPLFEDPLQLRSSALRRIDQHLAAVPAVDPFSIRLRDGSHIYGSIVSITEKSVSIHSHRHGDVVLTRSEVLSARRLRGGSLVFAGPEGDVGWEVAPTRNGNNNNFNRPPAAPAAIPVLTTGPGGALSMPYWDRGASLKLPLPERVDLEFRLTSTNRPDFQLEMDGVVKKRLSIETWDDDLVLRAGGQFKLIRKIAAHEREISLRVCWDTNTKKCSVFTPGGELLTEWEAPSVIEHASPCVMLVNKGRDLSLEFLRVRAWDGMPPPKTDVKQARVEMDDGRILEGTVNGGSADSIQFRAPEEDGEQSIPLNDVDALIFSADSPRTIEREATLSYADGTLLAGKVTSIKDGAAEVMTSFAEAPLASRMDALRQWRFRPRAAANIEPEPPFAELDKITLNKITLHGWLASAGDNWPRWLPVGAVKPAIPARGLVSEIKRAFPRDAKIPDAPALFYTSAGDVLPGKLRAIDRAGVEFESGLVEATKLSADAIDAVQIHPAARVNVQGFSDPGWQILKGNGETVHREKGALEMNPGTAIGHPAALQCSEISFSVAANNSSCFRLRMFCDGLDGTKSQNILIYRSGYQLISSLESSEGQFVNQVRTRIPSSAPVLVRLLVDDRAVELNVDGNTVQRFPIASSARAGSGLVIEPANPWGNNMSSVSLSGFSAISEPGRTWLPSITAETKKQALTVPRFRRDDPPRHALLASNGDVLRGEIEASTGSHFGFRSGLENLKVPIARVNAVIWLRKPVEATAPPDAGNPALKQLDQLDQRIARNVRYNQASLSVQIAFLKREAPELKFKLPEPADNRAFPMQFGGSTVGEALNQICTAFGLRYRIDGENTIVLEPAPRVQQNLVQKVYWLKPGAISGSEPAKDVLSAKGISFPVGATANWQPRGGQLQMTNTAASQEKLAKLIETDFGGSLGSPTHWLLLTNGARLGLVVDSFDKDFVTGHHPLYGRCKAPMSEIYAIRTSLPEPAAVTSSLSDWRLVYAPEPVLPEGSGNSSPTLGKLAKTFKLPLLSGGNFDLGEEKGKIIVLDFWATWCGPCVQSLPGLIEAMAAFPADRVKLIGVNQSEPADLVKRFLETRGWKLTVAMDGAQSVARDYGVDGIPHTVIIAPDGKVAWVKTGYTPDGDTEAATAVKQLLAEAPVSTAPAAPASATSTPAANTPASTPDVPAKSPAP
jgi:thiol-disulfide isomerase/thioredoxin